MQMDSLKPRVLVVEDDRSVNEIVSKVLEAEGYEVRSAFNGLEGMQTFYMEAPDLVILDLRMPEMNGWEVLERLRTISDCPVIVLTGFGATEDVIRGLELGADDYLVKPFGIQELLARVSAVLRRTNMAQRNMTTLQGSLQGA